MKRLLDSFFYINWLSENARIKDITHHEKTY